MNHKGQNAFPQNAQGARGQRVLFPCAPLLGTPETEGEHVEGEHRQKAEQPHSLLFGWASPEAPMGTEQLAAEDPHRPRWSARPRREETTGGFVLAPTH